MSDTEHKGKAGPDFAGELPQMSEGEIRAWFYEQGRAAGVAAVQSKLTQAEAGAMCPVCLGKPISGVPCICKGTNSASMAYSNLLTDFQDLQARIAALEKAGEALGLDLSDPPRQFNGNCWWCAEPVGSHAEDCQLQAFSNLLKAKDCP